MFLGGNELQVKLMIGRFLRQGRIGKTSVIKFC